MSIDSDDDLEKEKAFEFAKAAFAAKGMPEDMINGPGFSSAFENVFN